MKKTVIKIICLALATVFLMIPLASCSAKPILKLEDKELTVNIYQFLLSRMKGTLEDLGYKTDSEGFWNTIVSASGMTYGDFIKTQVLEQAYSYVVADYLFDKEGLTLPDEDIKNIETLMDKLTERAGSRINLNSELSKFGVNYNILKEIYTIEAKISYLKRYHFGENGEKIPTERKEKYLNDNFVAFKQIYFANYYYATETDAQGNTIYFVNADKREIAYDKVNGITKMSEFGKPVEDKYGNPVYYDAEGNIAYDKVNGVVSYMVNAKEEKIPEYYTKEELGKIKDRAERIAGTPMTEAEFDALILTESELEDESGLRYLFVSPSYYFNQKSEAKYLDDIAEKLSKLSVGQAGVVESDYGYHIVYKCANESGAYGMEKYKEVFSMFNHDLCDLLFREMCAEYEDKIVYDKEELDATPSMIEIASNTLY